jgi:UDP-N-acetylglucosamine 2-epimerase (non-hydrolysing)
MAAARPSFMEIAPLYHAFNAEPWAAPRVVHSGRHCDANMSDVFFADIGMPTCTSASAAGTASRRSKRKSRVCSGYEMLERRVSSECKAPGFAAS